MQRFDEDYINAEVRRISGLSLSAALMCGTHKVLLLENRIFELERMVAELRERIAANAVL
jgi:hypothetical protein